MAAYAGSQTVERALSLLACFSAERPEHTATELSILAGLTVPTTHRLLKTLTSHRYLVLDRDSKRYSIGPAVMQLAGAILHRDNVAELAVPVLDQLRRSSGETVSLMGLVDHERVCLIERVSHQAIRMATGVGKRHPLFAGASGKIMLAILPEPEQSAYLDRQYAAGLLTRARAAFLAELARAREEGYATSEGEVVAGAAAVAVAVRDVSGRPLGSINVTGPANRWTHEAMLALVPEMREAAAGIEEQLGRGR